MPSPEQITKNTPKAIAIIGGGISGLSCAWRLRKLGLPALLLERGARFGGIIAIHQESGFRFDIGPQSFLAGDSLLSLIDELNLTDQLRKAPSRSPRYILHRGRLVQAPLGPFDLLRSRLIGWRTKLRLICEPLRRSRPPQGDESIADFVRRKFGADMLANLVAPFVSGIYAGDPEKLSLASALPAVHRYEEQYGSVIRGAIKSQRDGSGGRRAPLCNFPGGVSALTEALATQLGACARNGAEILSVRPHLANPSANRSANSLKDGFELTYRQEGAVQSLNAAAIVFATPTDQAAHLLSAVEPRFVSVLNQIEYASVAQVSAGYRLNKMSPPGIAKDANQPSQSLEGFGFLVPRSENLRVLGTVWNSSLFPGRAPNATSAAEKLGAFTSFLGGATDPNLCRMDEQEIAQTARIDLAKAMGTSDAPVVEHVSRWERAIPQYNVGHARIVTSLKELCDAHPGIFLTGNYLTGPAIGACVEHSNDIAAAVAQFVAKSQH